MERIELGAMAERAAESVRPLMAERSHEFTLMPYHEPIWLEADPVRLDQILMNLLNNAAEFTDPGGHIHLIVTRETSEALIQVRDDGTGIAPDLLPHVFDLFTQADTSLDRVGEGSASASRWSSGWSRCTAGRSASRAKGRGAARCSPSDSPPPDGPEISAGSPQSPSARRGCSACSSLTTTSTWP